MRIGVDVGGTFTDFALIDDSGSRLAIHKQLTTPHDPSDAVLSGIKEILELNIKENSSIKDLREKIINYVDQKFKGNENYKKINEASSFCSEDNNIVSDNYKITNDKKIGLIPPIGGG